MLILSINTLTDTLRITSDQISRHSMAQSSWHRIWTIITTLAENLDGGYWILWVQTGLAMEKKYIYTVATLIPFSFTSIMTSLSLNDTIFYLTLYFPLSEAEKAWGFQRGQNLKEKEYILYTYIYTYICIYMLSPTTLEWGEETHMYIQWNYHPG